MKQFFGPIRNLSSQFQIFQKAFASVKRINDVFDMEIELIKDGQSAVFNKEIKFQNLSFAYNARIESDESKTESTRKYAVENLNFSIRKGEKIGIVGRTGCGKTTIASLLLKFYEDYEGSIKIDDKELKEISHESMRSLIGAVFQDTFLFPDTILNNIILDKNLTLKDVEKAIEELGVRSVFDSFPDGLNTLVKEDGTNLSSGEKQVIALIRVYIKNPEIFLLDEATSSIDNRTENIIYEALKKILKNRTAIIIAHRLSTIEFCDRILCFHDGKLVEEGRKEILLEKNGYFSKLYQNYKNEQRFSAFLA